MHKEAQQHASDKGNFLIGWGVYLAASIALLAINFLILPSLSNDALLKVIALPILETLLLYSALLLGIIAFTKVVNARFFNNETKSAVEDKVNPAKADTSILDNQDH